MITLNSLRNKEVIVYGTGINAVKCVSLLEKEGIHINYVIDGRKGTGRFKNYPVYEPSEQRLDGKYIIIACAEKTYNEIRGRLEKYQEFDDYVHYGWLDKKMIFLHGNCHMDIIESCLNSSKKFQEGYVIYPTPRICTREPLDESVLINMDIWIHEDIQSRNSISYKVSDEYLKQFMAEKAVEIIIPHLYGLGAAFFPHAKERNDKNIALLNGAYANGMFPWRDDVVEKCIEQDMDTDQICTYVLGDDIIPREHIIENFNFYMDRIREREKSWDIKILDFILENYKTKKLFYDIGHPATVILEKVSVEILKFLGISDNVSTDEKLDYHEVPVYPCISKVLGLQWTEGLIRVNDEAIKCNDHMDIAEYIKEYIWWCYPEYDNGQERRS